MTPAVGIPRSALTRRDASARPPVELPFAARDRCGEWHRERRPRASSLDLCVGPWAPPPRGTGTTVHEPLEAGPPPWGGVLDIPAPPRSPCASASPDSFDAAVEAPDEWIDDDGDSEAAGCVAPSTRAPAGAGIRRCAQRAHDLDAAREIFPGIESRELWRGKAGPPALDTCDCKCVDEPRIVLPPAEPQDGMVIDVLPEEPRILVHTGPSHETPPIPAAPEKGRARFPWPFPPRPLELGAMIAPPAGRQPGEPLVHGSPEAVTHGGASGTDAERSADGPSTLAATAAPGPALIDVREMPPTTASRRGDRPAPPSLAELHPGDPRRTPVGPPAARELARTPTTVAPPLHPRLAEPATRGAASADPARPEGSGPPRSAGSQASRTTGVTGDKRTFDAGALAPPSGTAGSVASVAPHRHSAGIDDRSVVAAPGATAGRGGTSRRTGGRPW